MARSRSAQTICLSYRFVLICLAAALLGIPSELRAAASFLRADVNQDGQVDLSDPVATLVHLFAAGREAPCQKAADSNDDGRVDVADAVYTLRYLFSDGPQPPDPFPVCGPDPTEDALTCESSACPSGPVNVELLAACPGDPSNEVAWTVRNLENSPVQLSWRLERSGFQGTVALGALGEQTFTTPHLAGVTEIVLEAGGAEVARLVQPRVIISEFMASNGSGLKDEDGDTSDWIEIAVLSSPCNQPVDLSGWYLTDDPDDLTAWRFPSVEVSPDGFLVIFASGKDRSQAGSELHTNFKLGSGGEYLALVAPDGVTVVDEFAPEYPPQLTDISYGKARARETFVQPASSVRYHVPSSRDASLGTSWTEVYFSDAAWETGTAALGFTGTGPQGFEVKFIKSKVRVDSLSTAIAVLNDPGRQSYVHTERASVIDYFNSGGRGNFSVDNPFPGVGFNDIDDFVVLVTGTILIPEAGPWSFGVNSDDGFSLELQGGGRTFRMEYPDPRAPADTIQIFNIPQSGLYDVTLVFYERGGGAELELFAAKGEHPTYSSDPFRLVGDTDSGGLATAGFSSLISTDVGDAMRGVNASLWVRCSFTVEEPEKLESLILKIQYEDGFIAYLNGTKVAQRNAPASPGWSSSATADRPPEDVPVPEEISLSNRLDLLVPGTNVLAIHALNDSAADQDFLLRVELISARRGYMLNYMPEPTPGFLNVPGASDFVRPVSFSAEHGFYDSPFFLQLSTETEGAQIRYTLDGSTPTEQNSQRYTGPIRIDGTTVIRARAFKSGALPSAVASRTYIFLSDVLTQSPNGQPPGPGWPSGSVNGQVLDYGMDPNVVNDPRWRDQLTEALISIPTISLVTDLENLFDPAKGIYVNARNDGRAWERPTSVELINPDGTPGFAVNAGLRIRGAFSRSGNNPKHSFRLFFRAEYGTGKLNYPLFGGEGVDTFDKVDLRTSQNYSWAFQGDRRNTLLRDVFSRDSQRDMGQPYTRSRYYHLYLNGQYWGIYQTQERADADFAASYLGGKPEEYDAIKNDSSGSRALHAADGTMDAYRRLYDAAVAGFASDSAYLAVQGLRPDGTPDPNGECLLDVDNLMDYMICTYYVGDPDSPVSCWAHFSNNVFALYNRVRPKGFTWYRHDAEHSLGANGGLYEGRLLTDPVDRTIGQEWRHFNPAWLHLRLTENREYLIAFADRVVKHFFHGGVFTPERSAERLRERARQIELAIIAHSARWGDAKREPPRTKDDWQSEVNWLLNTFFPQRTQIVLDQMRSVGMFPDLAICSFNQHGGEIQPGFTLRITQSNGTPGTIYYTLDGTDPRLWGGAINPTARRYSDDTTAVTVIERGSVWRYNDSGVDLGTAWKEPGYNDSSWKQGPAQLGYGDGDEATEVSFGPDPNNKYPTTYFRRTFTVQDASALAEVTLSIVVDDGAAVYINGVEAIPRINLPSGDITYNTYAEGPGVPVGGAEESAFRSFQVDPALLADGENVIAVEIHQASASSSDISFDLELTALVSGQGSEPIVLNRTTTVKARVYLNGRWGALTEARFTVGLSGLVINEFMASNHTTLEDPDEPGEFPDWIELYNGTDHVVDLSGMYLTDDLQDLAKWRFADGITIEPGGFLVILADDDGTQGPLHTNFKLSVSGEAIALVDSDGTTVLDSVIFDFQREDVSYGRYPDGGQEWGFHTSPTPGSGNSPHSQ